MDGADNKLIARPGLSPSRRIPFPRAGPEDVGHNLARHLNLMVFCGRGRAVDNVHFRSQIPFMEFFFPLLIQYSMDSRFLSPFLSPC